MQMVLSTLTATELFGPKPEQLRVSHQVTPLPSKPTSTIWSKTMEQRSDLWEVSDAAVAGAVDVIRAVQRWMSANSAVELSIIAVDSLPDALWPPSRSVTVSSKEEDGAIVTTVTLRSESQPQLVGLTPSPLRVTEIDAKYRHK